MNNAIVSVSDAATMVTELKDVPVEVLKIGVVALGIMAFYELGKFAIEHGYAFNVSGNVDRKDFSVSFNPG